MSNTDQIKYLYEAYKNRNISASELDKLLSLIENDDISESTFVELITEDLLKKNTSIDPIVNSIINNSEQNIISRTQISKSKPRFNLMRFTAAASIVVLLSLSVLYFKKTQQQQTNAALTHSTNIKDIEPGSNKATLKLSNGEIYELDASKNQISISNNAIILNDGNKLSNLPEDIVNLELSTPRKGNYQATLPDGSKVWLNAESSIKYPSKFDGNERVVEVNGEVYLEVQKNDQSKFTVKLSDERKIEVLGTKFNIQAYSDNNYIKTSLLEGKIKLINKSSKTAILNPGKKAIQYNSDDQISLFDTNIENDLAWTKNKFNFEGMKFDEIMKQIIRWYDVEVIYKSKIPDIEFYGELNKNNTLKHLVYILQQSGVGIKMENNILIIE